MNLGQKILPFVIVFGILSGCSQYSYEQERKIKPLGKIPLFEDSYCDREYNEGFFEDFPCDEDIFPERKRYWIEDSL
jgi:hypothetical protein